VNALELVQLSPVVPVVKIERAEDAVPLAQALARGGVGIIEITLRSEAAIDAIRNVAQAKARGDVDIAIGAGTVLRPSDIHAAKHAGAEFLVTPGITDALLETLRDVNEPVLPGASSASEVMRLLDHGYGVQKFFPASDSGGPGWLKSIAGPLGQVVFCPTGGINPNNAAEYLGLSNVACVGGSWLVPGEALNNGRFEEIEALSREAITNFA